MEVAVIDGGEVGGRDSATAVVVKLAEGLVNECLTLFVGGSADAGQEFIEINSAIMVSVESFDQDFSLTLRNIHSHVLDAPVEFLLVELAVGGIVHDSECAAESTNSLGATGSQGVSHLGQD